MSVAEDWGYQTDLEVIDTLLDVDGKFWRALSASG